MYDIHFRLRTTDERPELFAEFGPWDPERWPAFEGERDEPIAGFKFGHEAELRIEQNFRTFATFCQVGVAPVDEGLNHFDHPLNMIGGPRFMGRLEATQGFHV